MKQIELEDDLVDFLLAQERLTGVSPSEFLTDALRRQRMSKRGPLERASTEPRQRSASGQMAVFLRILAEMHEKHPETFERIANVRGRERVYFARSAAEIEASGASTNPSQIPGSDWWAIGTTSTSDKAKILARVFLEVGCSPDDVLRWETEFSGFSSQTVEAWGGQPQDDDPFKI